MLLCHGINFVFISGLIVVIEGQTTISWYSYIVALLLGCMMLLPSFPDPHRYFSSLCDTIFPNVHWYHGKWHWHQSNDEDGWRCICLWPSNGQPLCVFLKNCSFFFIDTVSQFTMWSHGIVSQAVPLASDLKVGQYLKIPPRAMFLIQLWGIVLGMHD